MGRATVVIRPAEPGDLHECFDVQKRADLAAFPHIFPPERYPFPDGEVLERWRRNLSDPDRVCLCAAAGGRVVGHAVLIGSSFDSIAVVPDLWGTSVACELHDALVLVAAQKRIQSLSLWVMEGNHRARRFYERRGWSLGRERERLPFPPHPILVRYRAEVESLRRRAVSASTHE